jgi:hypothetical protein
MEIIYNTRGITKGLNEHVYPKELREILEKYTTKEETTSLRISKIKEK